MTVILGEDGEHLFWQRPIGRLGYFAVPMEVGGSIRLEAWDAHGQALTAETFTRCDFSAVDQPPRCG